MVAPDKWTILRVELVEGRGEAFSPRPGRLLHIPPQTTFMQLSIAIDRAFARWDLDHDRVFTLGDGTKVAGATAQHDLAATGTASTLDLTAVARKRLKPDSVLEYVFDLTDRWIHVCRAEGYVPRPLVLDPLAGEPLDQPLVVRGWGSIPDQHGQVEDGAEIAYTPASPVSTGRDPVDLRVIRAAAGQRSAQQLIDHLVEVDTTPALQHIGDILLTLYALLDEPDRDRLRPYLEDAIPRLRERSCVGDDLLADALRSALAGEPPEGAPVPLDLDELINVPSFDGMGGAHLNLRTGEVFPEALADMDPEEFDVDLEDGDWVYVDEPIKTDWRDMADFIATVTDPRSAAVLEDAIEGKGAFSRFRKAVGRVDLWPRWQVFDDDRKLGKARERLSDLGLRAAPPSS